MITKPKLTLSFLVAFFGMNLVKRPNSSYHHAPKKHVYILFLLIVVCLLAGCPKVHAQVPVALMPPSHQQFFLPNGTPNAGGCLFFYNSGTSTPAPTYTDLSGTILQSNPVILDSSGYATIYLADQEYRVTMFSTGGLNCATGSQIWSQDGVSAYQIITGVQTIIFAGVTSFPSGSPGEVLYRTDLGRLCFFNSAWDCIPGLNTIDTFTNKTFDVTANTFDCNPNTAGQYFRDNGSQLVCANIQASDLPSVLTPDTIENFYTNDASGTTSGDLVKRTTAAFATITNALTTDTGGVVGICTANCGTTGTATVAVMSDGIACNFDGTPTVAGDYVTISATNAGNCHDAGATYPISTQVIGRVLNTGTSTLSLFPAEIQGTSFPKVVFNTPTAVLATNMAFAANMTGVTTTTATYRFSFYITVAAAGSGCVGATTVAMKINYTDVNGGGGTYTTSAITLEATTGGPGSPSGWGFSAPQSITFRNLSPNAITFQAVNYTLGGSCSPGPTYQVFPILEQLTSN